MSMFNLKYSKLVANALLIFFLAMPVWAQEIGWEKEWNKTLAAAKKEGKVVVQGPADSAARREIPAKFQARFGIPVEYISGRSSQMAARLRMERRARHFTIDVYMS